MTVQKTYDDAQYNVVHRHWFGLTKLYGGDATAGFTDYNTVDATSGTLVKSWYPRGPIELKKFGSFCMTALTNGSSDIVPVYLKVRGGSASAGATLNIKSTATAVTAGSFASTTTFTVNHNKAGEYLYIRYGTPTTDKGTDTDANTASMTGTFALFVDYSPRFDYSSD